MTAKTSKATSKTTKSGKTKSAAKSATAHLGKETKDSISDKHRDTATGTSTEVVSPAATPLMQLDGLFGHLSCSSGLFSKETFLSLYSCVTRMLRDHHQQMSGFAMTRTVNDDAFESIAYALEHLPNIPLHRMNNAPHGMSAGTGFLVVVTNRLSATIFWSAETFETFQMFEGGWTFHPADTKAMATHVIQNLPPGEQADTLHNLLENTPVDRRYDDKLNLLISALVNGLENRNRQLTVALDQVKQLNHQVVQSERLAAIGQLSSVIAHEIRNPLGLIDLYAKLVETQLQQLSLPQDAKGEALLKNLSQIRQATSCLETILSELTNYARPLTLNKQPVDLLALVHQVCEFYQPSYTEKQVALNFSPQTTNNKTSQDTSLLTLELDADRIRQALINLLKNALEASQPGNEVTVSIANRRGGNERIYVRVSDQGCGIAPEAAKKLFTPYFSTKKTGTGLGLAHSRKILQAHGGDVELLSSTPDKGSTFALILPKPAKPLPQSKPMLGEQASAANDFMHEAVP